MTATVPGVCPVCEVHAESVFKIDGMDCHEEVAILERRLKHLTGLEAMSADVLGGRLLVTYNAARLSASAISDAVADTGMRAWLEHEHPHVVEPSFKRQRLLFASGACLTTGLVLNWLQLAPAVSIVAFVASALTGGVYPARRALLSLKARTLDIHVLMTIAVAGAVALGEWSEAATVVFLFAVAQYLESRSMDRARHAVRALMDLTPPDALLVRGGYERRVPMDDVAVGDVLRIRPGAKVPLDGTVVAGSSEVNQAPITGESMPVDKHEGAELFAGTINGRGALEMRVTRLRRDTTLARIIHLVDRAQAQRAPAQAFVERFARYYTPFVITIAVAVALVPPLVFQAPALGLGVPRARPARDLVSMRARDLNARVDCVRARRRRPAGRAGQRRCPSRAPGRRPRDGVRQDGHAHHGHPAVVGVTAFGGTAEARLLALAAALESQSEHPIAAAIVQPCAGARGGRACRGALPLPARSRRRGGAARPSGADRQSAALSRTRAACPGDRGGGPGAGGGRLHARTRRVGGGGHRDDRRRR